MESNIEMDELDDLDIFLIEGEISALYEEIKGVLSDDDELSNDSSEEPVNVVNNDTSSHSSSKTLIPKTSSNEDLQTRSKIPSKSSSLQESTVDKKELFNKDSLTFNSKESTSFKRSLDNEKETSYVSHVIPEEEKICPEEQKEEDNAFHQELLTSVTGKSNPCLKKELNLFPFEKQLTSKDDCSSKSLDTDQVSADSKDHKICNEEQKKRPRSVVTLLKASTKESRSFSNKSPKKESSSHNKVSIIFKTLSK